LEQAVGRARLLREDCIVIVISNFPLRQAVMKPVFPVSASDKTSNRPLNSSGNHHFQSLASPNIKNIPLRNH